eukprot:gene5777-biopygen4691
MRKWKSNIPELRDETNLAQRVGEENVKAPASTNTSTKNANDKVLGAIRNQETDVMGVSLEKLAAMEHEPTQRGALRIVAAIYDPIGGASLVTILGKIIYHEVSMGKLG